MRKVDVPSDVLRLFGPLQNDIGWAPLCLACHSEGPLGAKKILAVAVRVPLTSPGPPQILHLAGHFGALSAGSEECRRFRVTLA